MLALASQVLIGTFLIVEALNLTYKRRQEKLSGEPIEQVHLRHAYSKADDHDAIAAGTSTRPEAGPVCLSRNPVIGRIVDGDGH